MSFILKIARKGVRVCIQERGSLSVCGGGTRGIHCSRDSALLENLLDH